MAKPTPDFGNGIRATKLFAGAGLPELPVREYQQGQARGHITCWELTPEEVASILQHRRIYLIVLGPGHPPVAVTTDGPKPQLAPHVDA